MTSKWETYNPTVIELRNTISYLRYHGAFGWESLSRRFQSIIGNPAPQFNVEVNRLLDKARKIKKDFDG